jgi:hypothetical protein
MKISKYIKREDGLIEVQVSDADGNIVGRNIYGPESYPIPDENMVDLTELPVSALNKARKLFANLTTPKERGNE